MTNKIDIKVQKLINDNLQNTVLTSSILKSYGFTYSDIVVLCKKNWLKKIKGAYMLLNTDWTLNGVVYSLNQKDKAIHLGGRIALDNYYGLSMYVRKEIPTLFTSPNKKLPTWCTSLTNFAYKQINTDFLPPFDGLTNYETSEHLKISIPTKERAMLEMLYLVPHYITSSEAKEIMQLITYIKLEHLNALLENCKSVKVVRLLFLFASLIGHSWINDIDTKNINFGSGVRTIDKNGKYYRAYDIICDLYDTYETY